MSRTAWTLAAAALAACSSTDIPQSLPHSEDIQADAAVIYKFDPTLLTYEFVDSTTAGQLRLHWVAPSPQTPFQGWTCFGFTPATPGDTVGTFRFIARDDNTGYLERWTTTGLDTIIGSFLTGYEGSRGTYILHPNGDLELDWTNGQQVRYFDPTATIRITGTFLTSDVTFTGNGDSTTATWGVGWAEGPC